MMPMPPTIPTPMTPTLFQRLLGASFYNMPATLRMLHGRRGHARYAGRASVVRGRGLLARLCARMAGVPPAAEDVAVSIDFDDDARGGEIWHRRFGDAPMRSRLRLHGGKLVERLGLVRLHFSLHVHEGALYWYVDGLRVFGLLPLPAAWCKGVRCREREVDGRYEFLVEAALPLAGPVVRYEGWLEPA